MYAWSAAKTNQQARIILICAPRETSRVHQASRCVQHFYNMCTHTHARTYIRFTRWFLASAYGTEKCSLLCNKLHISMWHSKRINASTKCTAWAIDLEKSLHFGQNAMFGVVSQSNPFDTNILNWFDCGKPCDSCWILVSFGCSLAKHLDGDLISTLKSNQKRQNPITNTFN